MKVLLVSRTRAVVPSWTEDLARFELSYARSLTAAAEQLGSEDVDAVVISADITAGDGADGQVVNGLTRLRERAHGAPLLMLTDGQRASALQRTLVDALLPASAPADVQAQLLELSAERAAVRAVLEER